MSELSVPINVLRSTASFISYDIFLAATSTGDNKNVISRGIAQTGTMMSKVLSELI